MPRTRLFAENARADLKVFVELQEGIEGLCHVSEMAHEHGSGPTKLLEVGSEHEFRVLRLTPGDRKIALRIMKLIDDVQRDPFEGLGKPEPLKHELKGCWSRRIDDEHRLVYQVSGEKIRILACRYHYS